ncbi:T9SS type A sorting domain-containing protein [Flavobacterium sp.]|uniref:T9SS type A sorting domain-containing protein n=1 Tax=Flavobacterium sp. TaxID=239 RepID=UPI003750E2B6
MKKIIFLKFIFFSCFFFGQTNTNLNVTIDTPVGVCNENQCIDLNANYFIAKQTTDYTVSSIPYNFENNIGFSQLSLTDDSYSTITLPFNFCFYNNIYSSIDVGANGLISFDSHVQNVIGSCPWAFSTSIPNAGFPVKNAIYAVYQDINPQLIPNGTVSYYTLGTAPNRKFILTFQDMLLFQCGVSSGNQTYQIILYETSNIIDVTILRRQPCSWNNGNGLIGIQNTTGTMALAAPGRNTGNWSASNESWRFSPSGNATSTITWTKDGVPIGHENPINVCFLGSTGNEVYTATVTYSNCNASSTSISCNLNSPFIQTPSLLQPSNIILCDQNTPVSTIDLTQNNAIILQNVIASDYNIEFYTTFLDAQNFVNPISNPSAYSFAQNQTIYVGIESLIYGCINVKSFQIEAYQSLLAPTGVSPQVFTQGQTLQNLIVNGTTISWYDAMNGGNLLPITTVLQNNNTYYASQSNSSGCQSKNINNNRLAVNVLNTLSLSDIEDAKFSVYPIPTDSNITINSIDEIEVVEVYNTIGQQVMNKQANQKEISLNLSDIDTGIYFLKIKTLYKTKIIKIIKK